MSYRAGANLTYDPVGTGDLQLELGRLVEYAGRLARLVANLYDLHRG